jgi:hypothetical protein
MRDAVSILIFTAFSKSCAQQKGASFAGGWVLMLLTRVLLEPCFPVYCACRLLWAGIATLAHTAGCFARQPEGNNGTVYFTLPEPDPRQLSRGVDLRAADIRQATRWASLDDLTQTLGHFLLCNGLE